MCVARLRYSPVGGHDTGRTRRRREAAMEVHPGVFVSNIATDDWETDPEVGGESHTLVRDEGAYAGMTRYRDRPDATPWTPPERETFLILEGSARIEIEGGPTLEMGVGDMASFPKGAVTTWHVTAPFKEIWFFARPYELNAG
jgi:uncharacterized cupin superfamily protein